MNNLYKILHINESKLFRKSRNINNIETSRIGGISQLILYTDKFHSYFHFEQSFAYLFCAYIYHKMGKKEKVQKYLEKSLFQDHTNPIALNFENPTIIDIFKYDRHFRYEDDFLDFAIGGHLLDEFAEYIDVGTYLLLESFEDGGGAFFRAPKESLIEYDPKCTHRLAILHALNEIKQDNLASALTYALEAARNLEDAHKDYHKFASELYKKRARAFDKSGQQELSKNDYIKAEDLYPSLT